MANLTMGDLATTFAIRHQSARAQSNLTRLAQEVTTGVKADIGKEINGDFTAFAGIERGLRAIDSYRVANIEAAAMFTTAQTALDKIQTMGRDITAGLLTAESSADITLMQTTGETARQQFSSVITNLNTRISNRSPFAGARTDISPLASGEAMLDELETAVAGLTTAADVSAAVDSWFDDAGGGFETMGYLGSTNDMGAMNIADDETAVMQVRADDQEIRDFLKGFAKAALVGRGVLDGDVAEMSALFAQSSSDLITNDGDITTLRTKIGATEERIENAQARIEAERAAYEQARTDLIGADPYEAATELKTVYAQIEAIYTITARISSLSFTDYMR